MRTGSVGSSCYRRAVPERRIYVTDAIVLSRFDLGEADRVLTLMTPEYGKLKAIAKGVRRQKSRLGGSLEPFAELRVQLAALASEFRVVPHAARVQDHHAIAHRFHLGQVVTGKDDAAPGCKPADEFAQLRGLDWIEPVARFVQHQQVRLV